MKEFAALRALVRLNMMPQRQQLRRDIVALLAWVALLHCLQHVKRKRLVPPGCSSIQQINAELSSSSPLGGRFLAQDEHRQRTGATAESPVLA
ncbi:MAG: hypothetical protein ACTHLX_10010 [Candidatus Binatia bacterium]